MAMRCVWLGLLAMGIIAFGAGCRKSEPSQTAHPPLPAASAESVSRIHWLGKKRLCAETNAAYFLSIWDLPASLQVEEQLLDKLSRAPWRRLKSGASAANASVALLRALLDDLVQEECYVEIGAAATNQPGQLAFAIRLSEERSGVWEKNLAAVLESLTGIRPATASGGRVGWSLKKHDAPNLIELTRAGEWTLVGLAQEHNTLLTNLLALIQRDSGVPFAVRATNTWLEADLDLQRVSQMFALGWSLPEDWPRISFTATFEGNDVRTSGELNFRKPLPLDLEKWNIPTNLIHEPLASFTAVQGIKPWLTSLRIWNDLQLAETPNQFYAWALQGVPAQTYFATPLRDASNQVNTLAEQLLRKGNPWFATNGIGHFERSRTGNGVIWTGPFMAPYVESVVEGQSQFAVGGFFPHVSTNRPPPADLIQGVLGPINLVGYDWELTGPRLLSWLYMGQLFRLVTHKAQLPEDSPCIAWLKAAAPKLGNCITVITRTSSAQISFVRKSNVGFTSVELHLLADWLESPQFPEGLHTFLASPSGLPPNWKSPPEQTPRR